MLSPLLFPFIGQSPAHRTSGAFLASVQTINAHYTARGNLSFHGNVHGVPATFVNCVSTEAVGCPGWVGAGFPLTTPHAPKNRLFGCAKLLPEQWKSDCSSQNTNIYRAKIIETDRRNWIICSRGSGNHKKGFQRTGVCSGQQRNADTNARCLHFTNNFLHCGNKVQYLHVWMNAWQTVWKISSVYLPRACRVVFVKSLSSWGLLYHVCFL